MFWRQEGGLSLQLDDADLDGGLVLNVHELDLSSTNHRGTRGVANILVG
jgi:hypothetical protein